MPLRVLLGLIVCNVIWAANPVMSKILLETYRPEQVAWLRYASATAFFLLIVFFKSAVQLKGHREISAWFAWPQKIRDFALLFGVGFSAFCFAPWVGLNGLHRTGAVDNALLIALEPVVTVILAMLFLGERLSRKQWGAFGLAVMGFSFLSGLAFVPASQWLEHPSILGSLILVLSLCGEAAYSIFARRLAGRFTMTRVFGSALLLGFLALHLLLLISSELPPIGGLFLADFRKVLALLWLGPLGSTLTYLYWLLAIERVNVSSAALTLFIQPIAGSFLGILALDEGFTMTKGIGASLILAAVGMLTPSRGNS
ncbi:MAG: hypothetical protein RJB38_906 [Pseudomonadota bacterium]|jgi:drug/metabolite transporter (DMT)-like permease